jgi:adenylate cyclase
MKLAVESGAPTGSPTRSGVLMRATIALLAILLTAWTQWPPDGTASYFGGEWLRDRFIVARADDRPDPRIVIIDIDESSLAELGPWPWPRGRLAELLEDLIGPYGARGVALDIFFSEPADDDGDTRLAMLSHFGPLVLAQAFDYDGARPLRVGFIGGGAQRDRDAKSVAASGFIANHKGLMQAAHFGNIGFVPDRDGMIRRLPLLTSFGNQQYPTLSLALFNCCAAAAGSADNAANRTRPAFAANAGDFWRVPYARNWSAYTVVHAADILKLRIPKAIVSGKLVLVGSSSLGLSDRVATPLSANTSGVLIHAAALSAMLDRQAGTAPAEWPGRWLATLFAALTALMAAYTFPRFSALANVSLLGFASLLWLGLAYLIGMHDAVFCSTGPLLSHLFLLAVAVPFDWQQSQTKSRLLLGTLRQYVAEAVVDELLRRNLHDPLAPVRRSVTTLIADMEGYTTHVETLSVEQASQLTRDFLDCLTRPVMAMHGTLDKYTGDGLVAFWGAPLPVDDHADQALDAALGILRAVAQLNQSRFLTGQPPLRVRIGIDSGIAMAGDFGTASRSIYTAVGDSVNTASRLESLARDLPYDVIIGPGTAANATRHKLVSIGDTMLRGKERSTALYTMAALVHTHTTSDTLDNPTQELPI